MDNRNNLMIPGGLLAGMGIGLAFNEVAAGLFIGLGAGFILSTIVSALNNRGDKK